MTDGHAALVTYLRRLARHSTLSADEQAAVLNLKHRVVKAPSRRDVVSPDHRVDHACLVAEGFLGRFDVMRNGSRMITALHIPGDMCDLHSVVAPVPGWGITALTDSIVLNVDHASLRAVAVEFPNLAMAFWRDTTLDASILAKGVANVGRKDATARVAHLLCEMSVRMEQVLGGDPLQFRLELTQEQIGDALGLTAVHVSRTLRTLRERGLATLERQIVTIHDWGALTSFAEFSKAYLLCDLKEPPVQDGLTR